MTTKSSNAKTVAISNRKGGVCKTATAVNTAAVLAEFGVRTLAIDLDPQGHTTLQAKLAGSPQGAAALFTDKNPRPLGELVMKSPYGFDVLCGGDDLNTADEHIGRDRTDALYRLRDALEQGHDYDVVLIDCPGNFGDLTLAGLIAAGEVLVPCTLDALALGGLQSLGVVVQQIVRRQLNPKLRISAILETAVDMRSANARVMHAELVRSAGSLLLQGTIRDTSYFPAAAAAEMPITQYDSRCKGAQDYRDAVRELRTRGVL